MFVSLSLISYLISISIHHCVNNFMCFIIFVLLASYKNYLTTTMYRFAVQVTELTEGVCLVVMVTRDNGASCFETIVTRYMYVLIII